MMQLENRVLKAAREGRQSYGLYVQAPSRKVIQLVGAAGMDFVRLDLEGGLFDLGTLEDMILFARACGVTPMVRVFPADPTLIRRVMNMGAMGITVPGLRNRQEVETVVQAAKSSPLGRYRNVPNPFSDYGYSGKEYDRWASENVLVGVQIECKEAVADLDNILQVEGLDMICSGRGSLAKSYGWAGKAHEADLRSLEQMTMEKAIAAGKIASVFYPALQSAEHYATIDAYQKMGVSCIVLGGDNHIAAAMRRCVEQAENIGNA